MDHTLDWVVRKYKQARKEEYEKSNSRVIEGFKSILLVLDSALNKGADMDKILPSYEDALKQQSNEKEKPSIFIEKQWWIQSN